jgi:hypothetical protein
VKRVRRERATMSRGDDQPVVQDADERNRDASPLRALIGVNDVVDDAHLLSYIETLGSRRTVVARVVHVVEHGPYPGSLSLETPEEAHAVVDEAVFVIRMAGIGADGVVHHALINRIARSILVEGSSWCADCIVVSARRPRCQLAPFGRGVRERLVRKSSIPIVLVSPRSRSGPSKVDMSDWT